MRKVILASGSGIRKTLLTENNITFEVIKPFCDEDALKENVTHLKIIDQALYLAQEKAKSVSFEYPDAYVIGSDQMCECEGQIISKSYDFESAYESLKFLSGKSHSQNNGTCIFLDSKSVMDHQAQVFLKMKPLSDDEIKNYINNDDPIGSAGSYKYESLGKSLFESVAGERETILGFGVSAVKDFLSKNNS